MMKEAKMIKMIAMGAAASLQGSIMNNISFNPCSLTIKMPIRSLKTIVTQTLSGTNPILIKIMI